MDIGSILKLTRHLAWSISLTCLAGCSHSPRFDASAREELRTSVTAVLHAYHSDICKEGLLSEFTYLDSSGDFHWQPPGSEGEWTFDSVAKAIRENAPKLSATCGEWKRLQVNPIAWDTALYEGVLEVRSRLANGDTLTQKLKENGVMVKRAIGWKLLSGKTELME